MDSAIVKIKQFPPIIGGPPIQPWQPSWQAWQVALLKKEWIKGTPSTEIGILISKSRNAVIGKAHRLGFQHGRSVAPAKISQRGPDIRIRRPKGERTPPVVKKMVKAKKVPTAPRFYPEARPVTTKPPISIMELKESTCRAIVGRAPNGLAVYCGDVTFIDKPFCEAHCAMYYDYSRLRRHA